MSDHVKIKQTIIHISNLMAERDAADAAAKEAIKEKAKEFDMKPAKLAKLVGLYHKDTYNKTREESEDILDTYSTIMGVD